MTVPTTRPPECGPLSTSRSTAHLGFCICQSRSGDGRFAEFGLYEGYSINYFARNQQSAPTVIYGFDSSEGLKEDWAGHETAKGQFCLKGSLPVVESNVQLIKGRFDQKTLPAILAENAGPFGLSSILIRTPFEAAQTLFGLPPRLNHCGYDHYVRGMLWVHDWRLGEWIAWQEYMSPKSLLYEYLVFGPTHVAVRDL